MVVCDVFRRESGTEEVLYTCLLTHVLIWTTWFLSLYPQYLAHT